MAPKPIVFIHTNDQQMLGARLGAFALKRHAVAPDAFDVRFLRLEQTPHLMRREGEHYLRKGQRAVWRNNDLQSFSPLRRMVPQAMNYAGRALVLDPDVFAVSDVSPLLTIDMGGKSIFCRHIRDGYRGNGPAFYASSVMLLDCAALTHWRWDEEIEAIFAGRLDYGPWIALRDQDPATIGELGEEWNSFDKLTPETKLLHTTERSTQPWRTGLPADYDTTALPARTTFLQMLLGRTRPAAQFYQPHPDRNQERFIFELMRDALDAGVIDRPYLETCIARSYLRPDAFDVLASLTTARAPQTSVT